MKSVTDPIQDSNDFKCIISFQTAPSLNPTHHLCFPFLQVCPRAQYLAPFYSLFTSSLLGQIFLNLIYICTVMQTTSSFIFFSKPNSSLSVPRMQIRSWLSSNFLKLSSNKTEVLPIGTASTLTKFHSFSINHNSSDVHPSAQAKCLGVILDITQSFLSHVILIQQKCKFSE